MKIITTLRHLSLPSALILHISLIFARGYFLSTEFTLYPYLVSRGFLPYRDIIDQHFPTLFFGPFSLPSFLTPNPWPLLGLFLLTLCLTDIFFYSSLVRHQIKKPFVWLLLFVISSVYFSGNILWIETFVNFLLSLWLFLSLSKKNLHRFVSGFLLSQILLLRPTIAPALLILVLSLSRFSWSMIAGGLVGVAIPLLFLIKQGVLAAFYRVAIQFNQQVYPQGARLLPGKREILFLVLWLVPAFVSLFKNKKYWLVLALALLMLLAYPRFGYEHLQPLFLVTIFLWAKHQTKPSFVVYFFIVLFFCLNLIATICLPHVKFSVSSDIQSTAAQIKKIQSPTIYLLGDSDILYPLSGKMPPNYTYVPSLPWYLGQKDFQDKIITSLKNSSAPVLIDFQATIDVVDIASSSGNLVEYIKMNYTEGEEIGSYQLFLPKL